MKPGVTTLAGRVDLDRVGRVDTRGDLQDSRPLDEHLPCAKSPTAGSTDSTDPPRINVRRRAPTPIAPHAPQKSRRPRRRPERGAMIGRTSAWPILSTAFLVRSVQSIAQIGRYSTRKKRYS
jgi:hypothetical protein